MRNYLLVAFGALLVLSLSASIVSAATTQDLQAQLDGLRAYLNQLLSLANGGAGSTGTTVGTGTSGSSSSACLQLSRNLYRNSSDVSVVSLQRFLIGRSEAQWPNTVGATGFFGSVTESALKRFQAYYGLAENGAGTLTRSKIQALTCGTSGTGGGTGVLNPPVIIPQNPPSNTFPNPTLTLSALPTVVTPGNAALLQWSSAYTSKCNALGGNWFGDKAVVGSETVTPYQNTSYSLSCTGLNGQQLTSSVTVQVTAIQQTQLPPTINLSFSASPITSGQSATLTWNAANATACTATGGWSGTKAISGSETITPTSTATYALTCSNSGGANTVTATLIVNQRARAPFSVHLLILDGSDRTAIESSLQEAIRFIEQYSRFKLSYDITVSSATHGYTHYDCSEGVAKCVIVNYTDVDQAAITALPVADAYALFWKANGNPPLHAGSAWWPEYGIPKGGVKKPYTTIPTDPWWFNGTPYEGFSTRRAQIMTHEIIHTLGFTLTDRAADVCSPLHATDGDPADKYESTKLKNITDLCYQRAYGI